MRSMSSAFARASASLARHPEVRRASRVAVAQMTSTDARETNMRCIRDLCAAARDAKCDALFLPEGFSFIGRVGRDGVKAAETLDGSTVRDAEALAREYALWISCGGFPEAIANGDGTRRYNTHVMISPECGRVGEAYRKMHLFDVDVPNGAVVRESEYTVAGEALTSHVTPFGNVGVSICYDIRFPDVYQALRFDHSADIIIAPSAFTKPTGAAHWETLLRARAIETQCYVIAAAQCGKHSESRESYGHAMIIDPWGKILAECDGETTGIAVADVSIDYIDEIRAKIPLAAHRRDVRRSSAS